MSGDYFTADVEVIRAILDSEYALELISHEHLLISYVGGCMRIQARSKTCGLDANIEERATVKQYICKVVDAREDYHGFWPTCPPEQQALVMLHIQEKGLTCSQPIRTKDGHYVVDYPPDPQRVVQLLSYLPGKPMSYEKLTDQEALDNGVLTAKYREATRSFKSDCIPCVSVEDLIGQIDCSNFERTSAALQSEETKAAISVVVKEYIKRLDEAKDQLETGVYHGDIKSANIIRMADISEDSPTTEKYGLIDFGVVRYGFLVWDLIWSLGNCIYFQEGSTPNEAIEVGRSHIVGYTSIMDVSTT